MDHSDVRSPRWLRTHEVIRYAYFDLLSQTGSSDVTISQIASHAHIHRKTFYLHYRGIEDLYADCVNILAQQYAEILAELPQPFDYYRLSQAMFEFFTSNSRLEKILSSPHLRHFADDLVQHTTRNSRALYNPYREFSEGEQELINTFVVYSSVNVWRRWIMSGKKVPQDEAVKLLGDLLEHGVSPLRAPYDQH